MTHYEIVTQMNLGAIMLVKEGDYTIVKMEIRKGKWIELIKELSDRAFSHIIETNGINTKIEKTLA